MDATENQKIQVMIADDHEIVREGLIHVVSKTDDIEVIGQAENGKEIIEKLESREPDVLLLDLEMPEKNGWEALKFCQERFPNLEVLILSVYPESFYGVRLIHAGASGYLNKNTATKQVVEAIRTINSGDMFVSEELAKQIRKRPRKKNGNALHDILSAREFEIFSLIVGGKKLITIAEELSISVGTVSTHRTRILKKFNMESNAELVSYAISTGLVNNPTI